LIAGRSPRTEFPGKGTTSVVPPTVREKARALAPEGCSGRKSGGPGEDSNLHLRIFPAVFLGYTTGPSLRGREPTASAETRAGHPFRPRTGLYLSRTVAGKFKPGYSRLDTVDSSCATDPAIPTHGARSIGRSSVHAACSRKSRQLPRTRDFHSVKPSCLARSAGRDAARRV